LVKDKKVGRIYCALGELTGKEVFCRFLVGIFVASLIFIFVYLDIQKMREILKRDQYSLIEDKDKNLYRMPSRQTETIKAIYEAFGLKRVSELTVLSQLN